MYFGPVTNNPGPSISNNFLQYSLHSLDKNSYEGIHNNIKININGFFMVFPIHVLIKNKYDKTNYFNPSIHFGGNEVEWFDRFVLKGGKSIITPRTFIYHYKLKTWRNTIKNDTCIYTINFGNYEGNCINLKKCTDIDYIYFTDNYIMKKNSVIYNCINNNVIFYYINTSKYKSNGWWSVSKHVQRQIKTFPYNFLPNNYTKSIYIDANIHLYKDFYKKDIDDYLDQYDIVCFDHPQSINKISYGIQNESKEIINKKLDKPCNINKIMQIIKKNKFRDNIGLTETCILIRNHINIKDFSFEWSQLLNICIRDQMTFDFLLWKHKVKYDRRSINDRNNILKKKKHINPLNRFYI